MIEYKIENGLTAEEFIDVLKASTLAERRPVNEPERIEKMLQHADLIITARENNKLVGVARSVTDFVYCCYLSDLAVDKHYQKSGIGKELIRQTKLAAPKAKLILLSAPAAVNYYPRIGMKHFEHCYVIDDVNEIQ
ncbi:MAG: GNAT family N-acetyltransferase [Ferruginibacter sp.]